jgi:hypothetical protein
MTPYKLQAIKHGEMMDEMPGPSQQNGMGSGPASSDNENPQDGEAMVNIEKSFPGIAPAGTAPKKRIKAPNSHMIAYEDLLGVADDIKGVLTTLVDEHGGETLEQSQAAQYKKFPRANYSM